MKSEKEAFTNRMLHIILLILKIIGIVLLCILGFLLLVIFCALFLPVRYRIKVCREEGEGKPPFTAYVKVTWLLHLVNILIRYPAAMIVRARIMLFTVFRMPGKEKKGNKKPEKAESKKINQEHSKESENEGEQKYQDDSANKTDSENELERADQEVSKTETAIEFHEAAAHTEGAQTSVMENEPREASAYDNFSSFELGTLDEELKQKLQTDSEAEGQSSIFGKFSLPGKIRKLIEKIKDFIDKIKSTVDKIKALFENIQYTIRNFCDKIKSTLDNIQYYREVMESDSFKQSMELCKGELGYVFRKLKPDKFEAYLNIGMEDPATMGQILAVYGMLYPLIGQCVRLVADFESESTHIEGKLDIRGRIRAFTFLRVLIRVYMDKDIRKLIKLLKKEAV